MNEYLIDLKSSAFKITYCVYIVVIKTCKS